MTTNLTQSPSPLLRGSRSDRRFAAFSGLALAVLVLAVTLLPLCVAHAQPPNDVVPCGAAVATCFSGQCYDPTGQTPGTINPNGPVLVVIDVNNPAANGAGLGANWAPPMYHGELPTPSSPPTWTQANLGEIFGVTLDDQSPPNIFVTAAGFYCGFAPGGPNGPGAVQRIDGKTAAISCIAQLPNSGVGLGNICYDTVSGNFFVSNFEDGMIYRVPVSSTCGGPIPPVCFNHGVQGRPLASPPLPVLADDGLPGTTQLGRRVWGVQVRGRRLYYSVWNENGGDTDPGAVYSAALANEIWSVGLDNLGNCVPGSAQREVSLPSFTGPTYTGVNGLWSSPVSDIKFSPDGSKMLLSERSVNGAFPNTLQPPNNAHISRVLEYSLSGSAWVFAQNLFIGLGGTCNSSAGGADYACEDLVWAAGDYLRGPTNSLGVGYIYGLAGIPSTGNNCANASLGSYLVDLDGVFDINKTQIGDVVMRRCCECLTINNRAVECIATNMTYQWQFCVTNTGPDPVKYLSILDLPAGVTVNEDLITLPSLLNPGQGTCLTLYITNTAGLTDMCFTVGAHTTNFFKCCSVINCITFEPCCVYFESEKLLPISTSPPSGNCYTYTFTVKNVTAPPIPLSYLFLVQDPPPPPTCITFSPDIITFNPPLLPNQSMTKTVNVCLAKGKKGPFHFLASAHDSNLVQCCSTRYSLPEASILRPIDLGTSLDGSAVFAGSTITVPLIIDATYVLPSVVRLYEGTNVIYSAPYDDTNSTVLSVTWSNVVAGTYTLLAEETDTLGGVWNSEPATVYVVEEELPPGTPGPLLLSPALSDGDISFSMVTAAGTTYHIECSDSLTEPNWRSLQTIVGDGSVPVLTYPCTNNAGQQFYRIRIDQ